MQQESHERETHNDPGLNRLFSVRRLMGPSRTNGASLGTPSNGLHRPDERKTWPTLTAFMLSAQTTTTRIEWSRIEWSLSFSIHTLRCVGYGRLTRSGYPPPPSQPQACTVPTKLYCVVTTPDVNSATAIRMLTMARFMIRTPDGRWCVHASPHQASTCQRRQPFPGFFSATLVTIDPGSMSS